MSNQLHINLECIQKICEKLSSPDPFDFPLDNSPNIMDSLKRALGWDYYDYNKEERAEFDEWLMIGNYKYFVSIQPSNYSKNQDLFNRIRTEAYQSLVALFSLPIEFTNTPVRLSFAISHIAGLDKKDNLINLATPNGIKPLNEKVFYGEIDTIGDIEILINNFKNEVDTYSLSKGFYESPENFRGFAYYRAKEKMNSLSSDYQSYKNYQLTEIAVIKMGQTGKEHKNFKNSVYVPSLGNSECQNTLESLTLKHQNYFQLRVDDNYATNAYISNFLNSPIGILERESLISGSTIKFISKSNLEKLTIPIPEIKVQTNINLIHKRLEGIKNSINEFEESLILNPVSEYGIKEQLDKIADILGTLSMQEKINTLIASGESKTVEFKETFSLDIKTKQKEDRLILSSMKTIAAFLNTDGGNLFIGVSDDGKITGIDKEIDKFDKTTDKFLLRFKNKLKHYFGAGIYPLIEHIIVKVNGKNIFQISCRATSKSIFVDNSDFYVRTNPATDSLKGQELYDYIENRKKVFVSITNDIDDR